MKKIWQQAEKINQRTGWRVSSVFLILNICFWSVAAFLLSIPLGFGGVISFLPPVITSVLLTGYVGVIVGLWGGTIYVDNHQ